MHCYQCPDQQDFVVAIRHLYWNCSSSSALATVLTSSLQALAVSYRSFQPEDDSIPPTIYRKVNVMHFNVLKKCKLKSVCNEVVGDMF